MDALTFGKRKDLLRLARKRIEDNPGRYVDYIYGEHDAGGTAWMTIGPVAPSALGQDTNLGNRPMGELTAGALGSVPMIIGFWPMLFAGMYGISKLKEAKAKEAEQKTVEKIKENVQTMMQTAVKRIEDAEGPEAAARVKAALDTAQSMVCSSSCKACKPGEGA